MDLSVKIVENRINLQYRCQEVPKVLIDMLQQHHLKIVFFDLRDESLEEFKLITKIYFDQKLEKEYKVEELF